MPSLPPKTTRVRSGIDAGNASQPTRVQDQIGLTVDRLLKTLSAAFTFGASTLTILLPTVFKGLVSFVNLAVSGTLTVLGATSLQSLTATTGTFSGTVTGNSVVSAQGFKLVLGPFQRSSGTFATTATSLAWGLDSTATTVAYGGNNIPATLFLGMRMPYAGSVVGYGLSGAATATTTINVSMQKNGVTIFGPTGATIGAGGGGGNLAIAKGAAPFVAGDVLQVFYSSTVSTTGQFVLFFEIEQGA